MMNKAEAHPISEYNAYQYLFDFFKGQHDLILFHGEMDDIISAVDEFKRIEGEEDLEKLALEKYPIDMASFTWDKGMPNEDKVDFDENEEFREGFIVGYRAKEAALKSGDKIKVISAKVKDHTLIAEIEVEESGSGVWVKAEDDLPDYDVYVLWCDEDGHCFVEALDKDGNDWLYERNVEGFKLSKVTHWQPLPLLPKEPNVQGSDTGDDAQSCNSVA